MIVTRVCFQVSSPVIFSPIRACTPVKRTLCKPHVLGLISDAGEGGERQAIHQQAGEAVQGGPPGSHRRRRGALLQPMGQRFQVQLSNRTASWHSHSQLFRRAAWLALPLTSRTAAANSNGAMISSYSWHIALQAGNKLQ